MLKTLFTVCLFLLFNTISVAGPDKALNLANGTLNITVDTAPAGGLPDPMIFVMQGFLIVAQNTVSWGNTWNLSLPSGNYRIQPLPVSDGTNFYIANSVLVFIPSGGTVNRTITYRLL